MIALAQHHGPAAPDAGLILLAPFALALLLYAGGVAAQYRRGRTWPWHRSAMWALGFIATGAAFAGPLAALAHQSFTAHAAVHVLVGMVAPLLMVLAAPFTLALRTLDTVPARRLSRLLRSAPAGFFTHPIVAAGLSVGSMWLLYLSPLYGLMVQNTLVQWLVMVHFLVSGFLYTAALIPVDPAPHRAGFRLRATVLVLSLAAHGILAKLVYANPPADVAAVDAHSGSMLMYYAGDAVDLAIIVMLCAQWYRYSGHRMSAAIARRTSNETAGP
jgi:putative membrane protein